MVVTSEAVALLGGMKLMNFVADTDRDLSSNNKSSVQPQQRAPGRWERAFTPLPWPGDGNEPSHLRIIHAGCHSQHRETFGKVAAIMKLGCLQPVLLPQHDLGTAGPHSWGHPAPGRRSGGCPCSGEGAPAPHQPCPLPALPEGHPWEQPQLSPGSQQL